MNKQELLKKIKSQFYFYELSINNTNKQNTNAKSVVFETWTKDARINCCVEIPIKIINNKTNKKEIYETINKLIDNFDFSFRTNFESVEEINEFLGGGLK